MKILFTISMSFMLMSFQSKINDEKITTMDVNFTTNYCGVYDLDLEEWTSKPIPYKKYFRIKIENGKGFIASYTKEKTIINVTSVYKNSEKKTYTFNWTSEIGVPLTFTLYYNSNNEVTSIFQLHSNNAVIVYLNK